MASLTYRLLFFRLIALATAVLGAVYLVPTAWIAFIYTLVGLSEAFAFFFEGKIAAGLFQVGATMLYGLAMLLALYFCYGFLRYAVQSSYAWRSRHLWVLASGLSGIVALLLAAMSAHERYFHEFWVGDWLYAAAWTLGFSLFVGVCWWWSPRA